MFDPKLLDEIAEKLSQVIPPELRNIQRDIQDNFRRILQSYFAKLDLVTREEFDVQTKVLAKTREKLMELEKIVTTLEQK
ncbi:MAG: accessory factor UbiK family protein [Legionellales bacterium]|nr:accessory factor UbiK family protein [Legionellales bacterium]